MRIYARVLAFVLLLVGCLPVVATGQSARAPLMATVTANAPIYISPKIQTPLRTAAVGTRLEVLEEAAEWTNVRFADPLLGPRVGWVETRLIRIERPELQPMDLSVNPTRPGPTPVQPTEQQDLGRGRSDVSALERRGFMVGFSVGGGTTFCFDDCGWHGTGLLEWHLGGMVNERTSVQYEGTGAAFYTDDDQQWVWQLNSVAAQFWTGRRSWLKVGGGLALLTCEFCDDYEVGPGFLVASGFEMVQKRKFVLDLQSRYTFSHFSDEFSDSSLNLSKLLFSLGFNWY